MSFLKAENLSFTYPDGTCALHGVDFDIDEGDFVTVFGKTGSGKTTLLRQFKPQILPNGTQGGTLTMNGRALTSLTEREALGAVGFVFQNPEEQIVTDKVWRELAFAPESAGLPQGEIRRRISEIAGYFGMEEWFDKKTDELSGGQKQLLNLASVMVMNPSVLVLDEPTAFLDPIAAADFIAVLKKLNRETALTVILAEHRLEELIPVSDKLLVTEDGSVKHFGETRDVCRRCGAEYTAFLPAAARLFHALGETGDCPLSIKEGRSFIRKYKNNIPPEAEQKALKAAPALEWKDVRFRYGEKTPDVLRGVRLTVNEGELFCLLGGNGSGKSTALKAAAGLLLPYEGSVKVFGKPLKKYKNGSLYRSCLTYLPQNVQTVFAHDTVREELEEVGADLTELPLDWSKLLDRHPYDLSGGEQQLTALAKALAAKPKLLLLDEPTKGLDALAKKTLGDILLHLKQNGVTIVCVTHDAEFAAAYADRCALFFRGEAVGDDTPRAFFSENRFYTTAANRMARGHFDGVITVEQTAEVCRKNGRGDA